MVPPCDSLAEAIVLEHFFWLPQDMAGRNLRPLLVFPEHRLLLTAIESAYAENQEWLKFWPRFWRHCERLAPGRGRQLGMLLINAYDDEMAWGWHRYDEQRDVDPRLTVHIHHWTWWYARLERVHEARQMIDAAHRMAERAWRVDTDGARAAMMALTPRPAEITVDIPG